MCASARPNVPGGSRSAGRWRERETVMRRWGRPARRHEQTVRQRNNPTGTSRTVVEHPADREIPVRGVTRNFGATAQHDHRPPRPGTIPVGKSSEDLGESDPAQREGALRCGEQLSDTEHPLRDRDQPSSAQLPGGGQVGGQRGDRVPAARWRHHPASAQADARRRRPKALNADAESSDGSKGTSTAGGDDNRRIASCARERPRRSPG